MKAKDWRMFKMVKNTKNIDNLNLSNLEGAVDYFLAHPEKTNHVAMKMLEDALEIARDVDDCATIDPKDNDSLQERLEDEKDIIMGTLKDLLEMYVVACQDEEYLRDLEHEEELKQNFFEDNSEESLAQDDLSDFDDFEDSDI